MNELANLVLLTVALEKSKYTQEHITWLLRTKKVAGEKIGGVWLVDLESLKDYEAQMKIMGTKKHSPSTKKHN